MRNFYSNLPTFDKFSEVLESKHYTPVPDDWLIVVTDVKGSTKAIEAGRYRDINLVGAACLIAIKNAFPDDDFPFVFGGDGVTLAVPPEVETQLVKVLVGLKSHARSFFGFDLRVGVVPLKELTRTGHRLSIAKQKLVGTQHLAMFKGSALQEADRLIKEQEDVYGVRGEGIPPRFDGLSCRWEAIPSKQGFILAILIQDMTDDTSNMPEVLKRIYDIFGDDLKAANPVNLDVTAYKPLTKLAVEERKLHSSLFHPFYWVRLLQIFLAGPVFKYKLPVLQGYTQSVHRHSDYRKFDGTLRMILDCTAEQSRQVRDVLEMYKQQRRIAYGCHVTKSALMTCFVPSIKEGEHIHFIDADQGGYAAAAVGLKAQLKEFAG